jgi:hypothetical protein
MKPEQAHRPVNNRRPPRPFRSPKDDNDRSQERNDRDDRNNKSGSAQRELTSFLSSPDAIHALFPSGKSWAAPAPKCSAILFSMQPSLLGTNPATMC